MKLKKLKLSYHVEKQVKAGSETKASQGNNTGMKEIKGDGHKIDQEEKEHTFTKGEERKQQEEMDPQTDATKTTPSSTAMRGGMASNGEKSTVTKETQQV